MSTQLRTAVIILVALVLASTRAATADDYSRLELDSTSIGFSSPGNAYGPWIFQNARYVFVIPGQGAINFEVSHQADGDVNYPTHGDYFAAGITHDFTSRFYGNVNFGYGTGNPYAKTDIHLEAAYKTTPDMRLVMDGAEDFVTYWSGQTLQQLSVGPTYYYGSGDVQVRYLVAVNSGAQTKSGASVAWDIVPDRRSKYTITGLFGPQQYLTSIPGLPLSLANYTGQTYTLGGEWQIGRTLPHGLRWGVKAGGFLSQINQATSGASIYTGRGLTFGAWTTY
jgi:YaiO family outer membrane protein